jgi:hypothetical protein
MDTALVYVASIVITLWGIAHIIPTRNVVAGFGTLSADNRRIITMEWVAEGLALSFIGLLALFVTLSEGIDSSGAVFVYRACAIMLVVMAGWTAMTGAKTSILPIKLCPFVKTGAAFLLLLGSVV